jgi:uncharacterized protein YwgA
MAEGQLQVLRAVMEALGYNASIATVEERKRRQKAVYLAQIFGVDLGYRYGWYLMGPYSTALARDYYRLRESIALKEIHKGPALKSAVIDRLKRARGVIGSRHRPAQLDENQWIERPRSGASPE